MIFKRHAIKKEVMIDGYVGFLSVTRNGRPRTHADMDIKSVQYLMGHSDGSTMLNVYTDNVFESIVSNMEMLESGCN